MRHYATQHYATQQPWPRLVRLQCLRCRAAASLSVCHLGMLRNSGSDYRWSLERNIIDTAINEWKKASACLICLRARGPIFQIFSVSSWTTGHLDILPATVTEIWTKCALRVLFWLNNYTTLNKNAIFCLFWFPQVVQEQTLGEVGTWTVIVWPVVSQIFVYQKLLKSVNPSSRYNG